MFVLLPLLANAQAAGAPPSPLYAEAMSLPLPELEAYVARLALLADDWPGTEGGLRRARVAWFEAYLDHLRPLAALKRTASANALWRLSHLAEVDLLRRGLRRRQQAARRLDTFLIEHARPWLEASLDQAEVFGPARAPEIAALEAALNPARIRALGRLREGVARDQQRLCDLLERHWGAWSYDEASGWPVFDEAGAQAQADPLFTSLQTAVLERQRIVTPGESENVGGWSGWHKKAVESAQD